MKKVYLYFTVFLSIFISCESKTDALLDKVMAVHDEVMPKMSDIMNLKKQLNNKIEELESAGETEQAARIEQLEKAVEDLENSHDGMMNWMREFNRDFDGMVQEEVLEYLNDQMRRIENVSRSTNNAIKNAEELLK